MSFSDFGVPAPNAPMQSGGWRMDVLGGDVSPLEVTANGTRHLHALWGGVAYGNASEEGGAYPIRVVSLDAPLVCPGDRDHLLRYVDTTQPDMRGGWHWNLHNNHWQVAFVTWYPFVDEDANGLARFTLDLATQSQDVY